MPLPHTYTGDPKNKSDNKWRKINTVDTDALKDPRHYLAPPDLVAAVNVALELGLPLFLTGEPGCGKSRLADAVAYELDIKNDQGEYKALHYSVKSDTEGRDLFYHFDTLGRFRNAYDSSENKRSAKEFIFYHGLGLALLCAKRRERRKKFKDLISEQQWQNLEKLPEDGVRSVVLIDEIDKAPREVPNDLLTEIEDLSFRAPEIGRISEIKLEQDEQQNRPIIIITSNRERELPPAFMRRCIYYHVTLPPFKDEDSKARVTIEKIVSERLGEVFAKHDRFLKDALALFREFQEPGNGLSHKPSLAELLQWLLYLSKHLIESDQGLKEHPGFDASLGVLIKPKNSQETEANKEILKNWKQNQK